MQILSLVHEVFESDLTSSCVSNNIYQSFCQLLSKEDTSIVYLELSHHCSRVGERQVFQHILYMFTLEICPSTLPQIRVQVQRLHQNSSPSPNSWDKVKSVLNLSEKFKSVLKYLLKHTPSPTPCSRYHTHPIDREPKSNFIIRHISGHACQTMGTEHLHQIELHSEFNGSKSLVYCFIIW